MNFQFFIFSSLLNWRNKYIYHYIHNHKPQNEQKNVSIPVRVNTEMFTHFQNIYEFPFSQNPSPWNDPDLHFNAIYDRHKNTGHYYFFNLHQFSYISHAHFIYNFKYRTVLWSTRIMLFSHDAARGKNTIKIILLPCSTAWNYFSWNLLPLHVIFWQGEKMGKAQSS